MLHVFCYSCLCRGFGRTNVVEREESVPNIQTRNTKYFLEGENMPCKTPSLTTSQTGCKCISTPHGPERYKNKDRMAQQNGTNSDIIYNSNNT